MSPMPETPEAAAASPTSQTGPAGGKSHATPRDAATAVIARRDGDHPRILMGQRGKGASFMPSKFVFPGGALDPEDHTAPEAAPLRAACVARLEKMSPPGMAGPLSRAAVRETFEETGLILGRPDPRAADLAGTMEDPSWRDFLASGHMPACDRLTFIFRAITPPYRPKRFDARFFLVDADQLASDPDDLSRASGELSHLTWLTIREARDLDLPLITEVVLAEVEESLAQTPAGELPADRPAPFFHHEKDRSFYDAL